MLKQIQFLFFTLLTSSLVFISACSTAPEKNAVTDLTATAISNDQQLPHQAEINEIFQLNNNGDTESAQLKIALLKQKTLQHDELLLLTAAEAHNYNVLGEHETALQLLTNSDNQLSSASNQTQSIVGLTKAETLTALERFDEAAQLRIYYAPTIKDINAFQKNQMAIWHNINQLSEMDVTNTLQKNLSPDYKAWLQLNAMTRFNSQSLDQQIINIENWQHQYAIHPAALIPPHEIAALRLAAANRPTKIAIILPFDSKYRKLAKAIIDGVSHAYYLSDYQPIISFYSADKERSFLDIYNTAVNEGAELIIGPLFKKQLEELYSLDTLPVATIGLNKLDYEKKPENLIEFSLSSEDEINTLIEQLKSENKRNALLLIQDAEWAHEDSFYFSQKWQDQGLELLASQSFKSSREQSGAIQRLINIDKSKQRIRRINQVLALEVKAEPRRRKDADFVYLLAKPKQATSIRPMFKFHYASELPIYANSSIYRGYANTRSDRDLNQINFTDIPWVINPPNDIDNSYNNSSLKRMYAFGFDALQLSERLSLMKNVPSSTLNGATGTLQLNNGRLQRTTAIAQFKNGKAQSLITNNN